MASHTVMLFSVVVQMQDGRLAVYDYNLAFGPLRLTVHWIRPFGLDWGA